MGPTGHGLLEAFRERCLNGVPDDEQISLVPEYVRAPDAKNTRDPTQLLCVVLIKELNQSSNCQCRTARPKCISHVPFGLLIIGYLGLNRL